MTVLLVLLFISTFIGIEEILYHAKNRARFSIKQEIYSHDFGLTMADGGEKIADVKKETK